jgi:hypothetical protein
MLDHDDYTRGGALASMLVSQAILNLLVTKRLIERDKLIEILEHVLLSTESMQADGEAKHDHFQVSAARGARVQINMLIVGLRSLPSPA